MSGMNFLAKLLDGVAVEWTALEEIGELVRGNGLPKTDFTESGVPAIHYGQIYEVSPEILGAKTQELIRKSSIQEELKGCSYE
jgi:hypothetical protein